MNLLGRVGYGFIGAPDSLAEWCTRYWCLYEMIVVS